MKKLLFVILLFSLLSLLFISCTVAPPKNTTIESDKELTVSYSLADLESFIKDRIAESALFFDDESHPPLFYSELDEQFPVEVLNPGNDGVIMGYTVYRITEGGYYYVFFGHGAPVDAPSHSSADCSDKEHMLVYNCAYYGALNKKSDFKSLKVGVSTAEDVLKIDPNAQWRSFSARGRVSSSLIRNNQVVEITYTNIEPGKTPIEPCQLVIKKIEIVPIEQSSSYFYNVPVGDLPG